MAAAVTTAWVLSGVATITASICRPFSSSILRKSWNLGTPGSFLNDCGGPLRVDVAQGHDVFADPGNGSTNQEPRPPTPTSATLSFSLAA